MTEYFDRLKAALADRYAIERELGAGGMATVYLARDLKHDRLVAVKVLDPDLAASIGADRFLREIQVTAKLNHPHILPLYDSGNAGGFLYYVMPFVEGESLADRIVREKQLAIKDAVQITREIAEALAQAHSYGLVHRDIKPQNVMMSGGHAIVADFGIATAVSQAGGEKLTKTGMSVGTPAYMSPEQAMAADKIDGRADIYSLGCVLYEMLVGQIPFTGTTPQQIIARHSMDHVPPPHIMRDTIPDALEEIILRAMAKLPADRYRTAFDIAEALGAVDTATAVHHVSPTMQMLARRRRRRKILVPAGVAVGAVVVAGAAWAVFAGRGNTGGRKDGGLDSKRVAVMYFEDLSRDSSLGHVADGLTEGLIEQLSQVRALDVVSRSGVTQFRASGVPSDSIARALQAGSLIEGSVEPRGQRVLVALRLVDGNSGAPLERASLELPAGQLLAVRDSVVREVAELLRARVGEEVHLREGRAGTASVEAWSLVQRAERLHKQAAGLVRSNLAAAVDTYQRADSLARLAEAADPHWAEPGGLRGQLSYERASLEQDRQKRLSWLNESIGQATRAIELEPRHANALALRGRARRTLYLLNVTPDPVARARLLDSAEADLKAATNADGTLASAWATLGRLHYDRKDRLSALIAARNAFEADAFLRNQNDNLDLLFWANYDLEQFPEAQQWCQEGARRFPRDHRFTLCQLWLMVAAGGTPDILRAWTLAGAMDTVAPAAQRPYWGHLARVIVGGALARAGLADSSRHVLAAARGGRDVDPTQELPGYEAIMRTMLGDYDEAIALLKGYVVGHPTHEFTVGRGLHWWWRPLENRPGFRDVMERQP